MSFLSCYHLDLNSLEISYEFVFMIIYNISFFIFLYLAETALKLDSLIGSVEEAVSSTLSKTLRKPSSVQSSEVRTIRCLNLDSVAP